MSIKKKGVGSEARAERLDNADADLQLLGEAERSRQLHKQKKRRRQGHEEDVCSKFFLFYDIVYTVRFILCYWNLLSKDSMHLYCLWMRGEVKKMQSTKRTQNLMV